MSTQNQTEPPAGKNQDDKSKAITPTGDTVTVDSSGASVDPKKTEAKKPATKSRRKKSVEHHYLAKMALLTSLIIAAGVFYLWQDHTRMIKDLSQKLVLQQQQINKDLKIQSNNFSTIEANNQALQTILGGLGQDQKQLSQAFRDLLKANRHLKQDWLISEAEYLVNLAGQRLGLMRDVETAISALKAADSRLRETGNPDLIAIRKALAKDINELESIQQADLTGLSLKLNAMLSDIDHLKLMTPKPDESILQEQPKESAKVTNWQELPAAMWRDIKKLIVIREHQGPIKSLLSPEQLFFLSQNLKLQLEQARLAMLSGETQIYIERINTAKTWIDKWFDPQDIKTQKLQAQLDDLLKQNIHPQLPSLRNSFSAFKVYQKTLNIPESVKSELKSTIKKPETTRQPIKKPIQPEAQQQKPVPEKQKPDQPQSEVPLPEKAAQVPL